jgi:DNA-binding IclR family transcriptional regulator
MRTNRDRPDRSVLGRALALIDCFADAESEQTLASLCERTGLPAATVHRMLSSLVDCAAVQRTSRGHYRLADRMWKLGWDVPGTRAVREILRPIMVDLYSASGEIVVVASRDRDRLLLVDQLAGRRNGDVWALGRRVPMPSIAPGLVCLAYSPPPELSSAHAPGPEVRGSIAGDDFAVRQQLAQIRITGIAVTSARHPGFAWVSAPVFDFDGSLRTTLSLALPQARLRPAVLGPMVAAAARAASRALSRERRMDAE